MKPLDFIELTPDYYVQTSAITSVWFAAPRLNEKPNAVVAVREAGDIHVIDPACIERLRAFVAPPRLAVTLPAPDPAPAGDFYEAQAKAQTPRTVQRSVADMKEIASLGLKLSNARAALQAIADRYDARSELFTSDAECAQNLAATARTAIAESAS